jgi:sigma-B regulation protein RsbU (phosphoserine phosphatase)
MATGSTTAGDASATAPARKFVGRYLVIACLLAITLILQVMATISVFQMRPTHLAHFSSEGATPTIDLADTASNAAGIHKGDTLVSINGRPYTGWAIAFEESRKLIPGTTLEVTVRSPESPTERTVVLPVTEPQSWLESKSNAILLNLFMPAFCALLGFWVVLVRPADFSAWLLLSVLLGLAQTLTVQPVLQGWSGPALSVLTAYTLVLRLSWPISMFLFGLYFPEPLPFVSRWGAWGRRLPWLIVAPYALMVIVFSALEVGAMRSFADVHWAEVILHPLRVPWVVYQFCLIGAFFAFIGTKSGTAISSDARRRLLILYWGATIAFTPLLVVGIVAWLRKSFTLPDWLMAGALLLFCLFPLTLAYVIVVQRAMDVRVVLRQGLQYALARNGIRVLQVLALGLVAATFLALSQHRETPQKIIVIAIGLAAVFGIRHGGDRARDWLDRKFFREAYDTDQVLSELSDSVRSMVEVPSLVATVAQRISETLHIPRVAVLLQGSDYRPAYALGYGAPPDVTFPAAAGTIKVLAQGSPARVYLDDPHSWVHRAPDITDDERDKLAELQAELLLPLNGRERLLGFISLGHKRSEEPYSRTDLRLLKSVAMQTGLALENAHLISAIADEVAQRERLNSELEIARDVQERLFPQKLVPIEGIDYAGACRPALGVGGDYYDFLALPDGKLGIAIGDVSGKGIAAALTMASLQASLRSEASRAPEDLAGMIGAVNRLLHEALASNRYATFFYALYDPKARRLHYVNAGHNPPMLFHPDNGRCSVTRLEPCGTVVGILSDACYEQRSVTIAPGDVLVAFTDGVSEAMNPADDEFGEDRLISTVETCVRSRPGDIISCVMKSADTFAAGAKQHDDMTLVVLSADSGSAS